MGRKRLIDTERYAELESHIRCHGCGGMIDIIPCVACVNSPDIDEQRAAFTQGLQELGKLIVKVKQRKKKKR